MKSKLKISIGTLMALSFAIRPINCTPTQNIILIVLGMLGGLMILDGLTNIEFK